MLPWPTTRSETVADDPIELGEPYAPPDQPQQPRPSQPPQPQRAPGEPVRLPPAPVTPAPRQGSALRGLFWLLLLGVGGYGGYFGYCRYKVGELEHAFSVEMQDFRQKLIRKGVAVSRADVPRVVSEAASKVGVAASSAEIQVTFEPLTAENTSKLPGFVQGALGLAASIPGEKKQLYLVGYQARAFARHGVAKRWFDAQQYTYLEAEWVSP
jgi:hypothetical protein